MANRRRGEISAMIDGRQRTLCLTLGGLAELEDAFGVDDLAALSARFASGRLSSRDLVCLLGAGLRGAGEAVNDQELAAITVAGGLAEVAAAVGDLLDATFGDPASPGDDARPF